MFEIKSEELGLDGEFDMAFAVFGRGNDGRCVLRTESGDPREVVALLCGVAELLSVIAEGMGIGVVDLCHRLAVMAGFRRGRDRILEELAGAEAASAVAELCDELDMEMPQ